MQVRAIVEVLHTIAPPGYAAEWDNVGLLIGSYDWPAPRVMLTIDLTEPVLGEAEAAGAGLIVSYHPPIFGPLARLTDQEPRERIALEAVRAGIAVYSPHTALDAAPGGVNDWLAAGLGPGQVRPLDAIATLPESEQCKLVTFCPADAADNIRRALAEAGAGRIGDYHLCSFEIKGTGTFLGGEETQPAVGAKGSLQRVDEIRLEMVCPESSLGAAIARLRQTHPYEEPPIEIYRLQPRPHRDTGQGRVIELEEPATLSVILERTKRHLGVDQLRVAVAREAPESYQAIGLCAGAGGSLRRAATDQRCQLFLTGEMRHHDILAAQADGCTVVLAGHTNTERGYLPVLRKRLIEMLPPLTVDVSREDADPLRVM